MRDTERLAILRELLVKVRERSGSSEEPHEQYLEAASRPRAPKPSHSSYQDAYAQAVLLPPPDYEDTQRWSTLLAEDPVFSAPIVPPPAAPVVPPSPPSDPPEPSRESLEVLLRDSSLEQTLAAAATEPEPAPSAEHPPLSQPRSSGHFEESVARAVETLDASTILSGAGTDLKRRGNLLSTHAKKRDEPRLLRSRTPRSGSVAAPRHASPSTTPLPTEAPAESHEPVFTAPERARKPSRRVLPMVAVASIVLGVAVTLGLAKTGAKTPTVDSSSTGAATPGSTAASTPGPTDQARAGLQPTASISTQAPPPSPVQLSETQAEPRPAQPRTHGILRVDSKAPGRVFVQGIDVGPTGAFLELSCGMKFVRIAHHAPPPPGQSFPNWVGQAKSVMVPCGQTHRVEFGPDRPPAR